MANSNEATTIQVLGRAARIVSAVAAHPYPARLAQLSTDVALPDSTVLRILRDLQVMGYVCQVPESKRWKLGPQLANLANTAKGQTNDQAD